MTNRKFVLSLYPTAKYYQHASVIFAATHDLERPRTYILGFGKNEKNAWKEAAAYLLRRTVKILEE